MAGIGFSLRKILNHDSLTRTAAAYTVAGLISGGPWLLSVLGIVVLAILVSSIPEHRVAMAQFQMSITYITAASLILSGSVGNAFSRYIADQIFLNKTTYIIPNLNGMLLIVTLISGVFSFACVLFLFQEHDIAYRFMLMGSFIILSNIWIVITLITALKDYKIILKAFFLGYSLIVLLAYLLSNYGLNAFMLSFLLGQAALLLYLLIAVYIEYPTQSIIDFHFMKKDSMFKLLFFSGYCFNFAVWVDKFIFWYNPSTSYNVLGPFRASWIYDLPIFLSYLCLLPGMAVFLLLIETNFADIYTNFNESIRRGKSLTYIKMAGDQMISTAYNVIFSIVKIQAITIIIVILFGERILTSLHISGLHYNLFYIAVIGVSLQVVLLAIIDILYYMDKRRDVFLLAFSFFVLNLIFTLLSLYLGPWYYGFGFTCSLGLVCTLGMYLINTEFTDLEYKIIMLR